MAGELAGGEDTPATASAPTAVPPDPEWEKVPPQTEWERLYRDWVRNGVPDDLDWMEIHRIHLGGLSRFYQEMIGGDLPEDAEFIRFVSADEKPAMTVRCLQEQGFQARVGSDGGVFPEDVPLDQSRALLEALYRCDVRYPVPPRYLLPPTVDQLRVYYDYYVNELVPCLRAGGQEVPDPPTWETFVGTYHTKENWHPYHFVETRSPEHKEEIHRKCPHSPSWDDLLGEQG